MENLFRAPQETFPHMSQARVALMAPAKTGGELDLAYSLD